MKRFFCHCSISAALLALVIPASNSQETIDTAQFLQGLKAMKEQQAQQAKAQRQRAIQEVQAAAASPSAAAASWEEAVRQVQFEGMPREGAQFREWKEKEGAGLDHKDGQNAARLYFMWLGLTLQRSAGVPTKELLPNVIAYTKDATAVLSSIENFEDKLKREKEKDPPPGGRRGPGGGGGARDRNNEDDQVRRICDVILRTPLPGSIPVKALKLEPSINAQVFGGADGPPGRQGPASNAREWEMAPGNVDGIFQKIILPELRAQRDPRLLEFWDVKIKREGEAAAKSKLAFDLEKFNQVRRPELLWSRAEDELLLGQRSKALNDMFNLIKANPGHPAAAGWITQLETLLAPPAAAPAAASTIPPAATAPTTNPPGGANVTGTVPGGK